MCRIATDPSPRLMVDPWEADQSEYTRTALVLDHFHHEVNTLRHGVATVEGGRKSVRIALLAGADLIGTMSTPGVWSDADLNHILGRYGAFIVERTGTDIHEAMVKLQAWRDNIYVIPQPIQNDVSSTKIRNFLSRDMSIHYLIPGPVIQFVELLQSGVRWANENRYIEEHSLYEDGKKAASPRRKVKSADATAADPILVAEKP